MIESMEKPFSMFEIERLELERDNAIGDTMAPHGIEKALSDQIHKITSGTPWLEILLYCLLAYAFLTCCVCFFRPCFFDLANCCGGIYLIVYIMKANNREYRYYSICLLVSFLFDLLFLMLCAGAWWANQHFDGQIELGMRRYSVIASIVLMIFKIPFTIMIWHTSIHYYDLIQPLIDKLRRLNRYGRVNFGVSGGFGLGYSYLLNNRGLPSNSKTNQADTNNYLNQNNGNYNASQANGSNNPNQANGNNANRGFEGSQPNTNSGNTQK